MSGFVAKRAKSFNKNKKGVTMLEYGLIAALIAVVSITALTNVGKNIATQFTAIATKIGAATPQ
jgi:pilus assembly protein Flp/PilA